MFMISKKNIYIFKTLCKSMEITKHKLYKIFIDLLNVEKKSVTL